MLRAQSHNGLYISIYKLYVVANRAIGSKICGPDITRNWGTRLESFLQVLRMSDQPVAKIFLGVGREAHRVGEFLHHHLSHRIVLF